MKTAEIITEFSAKVMASLQAGTFVRLTVTRPDKVLGRLVEIQGQPVLSLTFREATRDVTQNWPVAEVAGAGATHAGIAAVVSLLRPAHDRRASQVSRPFVS